MNRPVRATVIGISIIVIDIILPVVILQGNKSAFLAICEV